MEQSAAEQLVDRIAALVAADGHWILVHRTRKLVQCIPSELEAVLPPIGTGPSGASRWLTLDLVAPNREGGLGVYWHSNPAGSRDVRNAILGSLLTAGRTTGFEYRPASEAWREVPEPAFSGGTVSGSWWPTGSEPNLAAGQQETAAQLSKWAERLPAILAAVRAATHGRFVPGQQYTRDDVQRLLGLEPVHGGNWFTGYHQHGGEWYLFPGVGTGGRTGHVYGNRWQGDRLVWFSKTGSHLRQDSVRALLADGARVHLFTRSADRDPFTYEGLVRPAEVHDEIPVRIHWELVGQGSAGACPPQEVDEADVAKYPEGALRRIMVNAYERNPAARRRCLEHWGTRCAACTVDLGERYGPIAEGFIHVHHLRQLAELGEEYDVDPVEDLRPLCPNCHSVVHRSDPPLSLLEVQALLAAARGPNPSTSGAQG